MKRVDDELKIFGENLFTLICQKNWTVKRAASELDYGRNDLSAIINGTKNFQLKTAVRFAERLNVSLSLMFSRQFDNEIYRTRFIYVDASYIDVFCENLRAYSFKRTIIELDSSTMSKIMNGRYRNPTIKTLSVISSDVGIPLAELLKTTEEKERKIEGMI